MQNQSTLVPPAAAQRPNVGRMQGREVSRQLNDGGHFVNGFIANGTMTVAMQPFFTLKTYVMNGQGLPPVSKLYRGLGVNIISGGPAEGITFLTHHLTCRFLKGDAHHTTDGENLAASVLSGALGAVAISPCERVMIQQQVNGGSIRSVMRMLHKKEGWFKGMTKGMVPTAYRDGWYNCGIFALNDIADRELRGAISDKSTREVVASGSCGSVIGATTAPMDRVKTMMQADSDGILNSSLQTAKKIIKTEGAKSLFRGAGSRSILVAGATYCVAKSKKEAPKVFPSVCFE